MKQWKKGVAVLLAFVLVIAGLNISPKFAIAADTPQFYADAVTAEPGRQIEVPIKISGNTGIMGLGLRIGFDKQVLTPVDDVKQTSLLVGQFNDSIATMKEGAETFDVKWSGTDGMKDNGQLFTLKFQVAEGASGSTAITLTLLEDDTFDEEYENVAVGCKTVKVTVKGTEEPDKTAAPTKEPVPDETAEPEEPKPTEEPWESTAEVYLMYYSDGDWTEYIDGYTDDVNAHITGNGQYSIEFKAAQSTENIYRMELTTLLDKGWLPAGMRIVPVTLTVGNETYSLSQYKEHEKYGYTIVLRDLIYGENFDGGIAQIPVSAGDVVKVTFKIEGIGDAPTPSPSATEPPAAPTNTPGVQTSSTQTPSTQKPSGNNNSNQVIKYYPSTNYSSVKKKPKKVKLTSVKAAGKKKLKVKWKWLVSQDGFQVQYATNRRFTKNKKTVNTSAYTDKKTFKGLKSKKTYYVRVRAYYKVSGKKYYGAWSNVKKCKVK